jgi:hypothetical protein
MLSALLPLGLLGALAAAWWKWGWEGFGWVSLEQLEENLETVRKYVAEKLEELKGEMLRRFSSIGEMLTQCTQRVEQVRGSLPRSWDLSISEYHVVRCARWFCDGSLTPPVSRFSIYR